MVEEKNNQIEDVQQVELGLEHTKALLEEADIPCKTHLLILGLSPGEDLVKFARENKIDEIIVGVRKRSKVGKLILGSTAQHVILTAPCPVVTINGPPASTSFHDFDFHHDSRPQFYPPLIWPGVSQHTEANDVFAFSRSQHNIYWIYIHSSKFYEIRFRNFSNPRFN